MNKLCLLLAFATLLLFSNCGRDKDPEPVTPQTQENSIRKLLLGKWRIQFTATDWNRNGIPDEDEKEFSEELVFITINIDGTLNFTDEQGTSSEEGVALWTLHDKDITLTFPQDSFSAEDSEPYTIVSLTTIDMLWKTPEDSANFFYIGFIKEE